MQPLQAHQYLASAVQMYIIDFTFGETVFRELRVHAHHVDRSCEETAKHLIWDNFPPVLWILQIMLFDVRPYLLHDLQQVQ